MTKSLSDFSKELSNYISLGDGESYTGIYKGFKFIEKEMQGETKEYARYLLEDPTDRKVRNLDSRSGRLAKLMEKVAVGQEITISRTGEGFDTKYTVKTSEGVLLGEEPEEEIPIVEDSD